MWASFTTLVKTRGDKDSPKGRTLYWYAHPSNAKWRKQSVSGENWDMKVCILQVDRCKPIEKTDTLKDAFLASTILNGSLWGPVSGRIGPGLVLVHHLFWVRWSKGCLNPDFILAGWIGSICILHQQDPRFLQARQKHLCSTPRWTKCPWTESRNRVWWFIRKPAGWPRER